MNPAHPYANILIVDDTSEHLYNAGHILRPLSYPIRVALTGRRALELIEEQKPTVLLLDVMLEDMNGFSLCRLLKNDPRFCDIAIIFVTGLKEEETIQEGFRIGGQDYVTKPYRPLELVARVQNQMQLSLQSLELKHACAELDLFCRNVSHDLKSPLLVIEQLASLLVDSIPAADDGAPSETAAIADMLTGKCRSTLTMVERLLELSHVSQMPLHETNVDLQTLFSRTAAELTLLEPERRFDIAIDESLPFLSADEDLLKILVQNVLSNAIKFTRNCEIAKIHITGKTDASSFTLQIKDNGAGFDPKYTDKLFAVFSRLHTAAEFEGSGVGLTIIARIMKMHDGTADITREPKKGAVISLHFPLGRVVPAS